MRKPALFAVLLIGGCGALSFDVDQDLPEQTVQGSALGGVLPSFIPTPIPLSFDLRAETAKRGTGPAQHAYLKSLVLRAKNGANFDFLDEAHVYVSAPSLPRVEIARLAPVPRGAGTIEFAVVDGVDLLPYINAGASIDSTATGTQPKMDVTFDGTVTVTVKV